MDFSYEYTTEQQQFRANVSGWLDRNVPNDLDALIDSPDGSPLLAELSVKLGRKRWLAPSESIDDWRCRPVSRPDRHSSGRAEPTRSSVAGRG